MKSTSPEVLPLARRDNLVIKEVAGETLVYDLERHTAHCLNEIAAFVWEKCDGKTPVAAAERMVHEQFGLPESAKAAGYALSQLEKAGLVAPQRVPGVRQGSLTRREMLKVLGSVAASLPLVTSIVAPTPAQAASLLGTGSACTDGAECASGSCIGAPNGICF